MVVPLGWYPSCLTLEGASPLKVHISNKYSLYKVYMGLSIKGTCPYEYTFEWKESMSLTETKSLRRRCVGINPIHFQIPRASFGHLLDLRFYMLGRHYSRFRLNFFSDLCLPLWLYLFCSVEYVGFVQGNFKVIFLRIVPWDSSPSRPTIYRRIFRRNLSQASYLVKL